MAVIGKHFRAASSYVTGAVRHVIRRWTYLVAAVVMAGAFVSITTPASAVLRPGWSPIRTPNQEGTGGALSAVSCATTHSCVAVGSVDVGFKVVPAGESWNGHNWSLHYLAVPAHGLNTRLAAVSCSSARACIAVGSYQTPRQARRISRRILLPGLLSCGTGRLGRSSSNLAGADWTACRVHRRLTAWRLAARIPTPPSLCIARLLSDGMATLGQSSSCHISDDRGCRPSMQLPVRLQRRA